MSTRKSMSGHHRPVEGMSNDWLTPPHIIEALGPFDLDPCASVDQPWPTAALQYTLPGDGYAEFWPEDFLVWLNPPFNEQEAWLRKLAEQGNGIALVAARTETRWFVEQVWERADAILFLHGRPHFHYPRTGERAKANSGVPIVLVAYGKQAVMRLKDSGLRGSYVSCWKPTGVSQ